jgi:hypothetical protein
VNIDEYYQDLRNKVSVRADTENDYTSSAFVGEVADELETAGEVESLTRMHFEGVGSGRKKLLIDGYDLDNPDSSVALAALIHTDTTDLATLPMSDAKRTLTQLENFLRDSLSGDFLRDREESSQAYMLARSLQQQGRAVTRYRLFLVTDAKLSERSKNLGTSEINGIPVEYHIWDITRLHQIYESKQGREELDIDLTEWLTDGLPALEISQNEEEFSTYLAAVPGSVVADLYERYGSRLLESNVRSYLSARGKVNKNIRVTVQSKPEMFLAYNNGITATATGVKASEKSGGQCHLRMIRDLQIVNGGQTTASLFFVRREDKAVDLSHIYVQMKLVVVDPDRAALIVPDISRYANSQNRVSEVDFFSNSAFHIRMEELSRRILAPAKPGVNFQTKWFYERTRGQYANEKAKLSASAAKKFDATYPRKQVIDKTALAKYVISFEEKPYTVSAGAQKNFVAFAESVGARWEKSDADFNELYFKETVAKAIVYNDLRALIARATWYDKGYLANIVTYTIAKLVQETKRQGGGKQIDLTSIWSAQAIPDSMAEMALTIGKKILDLLTDPNRKLQNVTEWAKKKECWDSIEQARISLSEEFLATLTDSQVRVAAKKEARRVQKVDNSIEAQMRVMGVPPSKWNAGAEFGTRHRVLSPRDLEFIAIVTKRRVPSELQSVQLMDIMNRLTEAGFDFS